jgi:hypothetical protein
MPSTTKIALIIAGVMFLIGLLNSTFRRATFQKFRELTNSWTDFSKGTGLLQLIALLVGGLIAFVSIWVPASFRNLSIGEVKEFKFDPSKQTLYHHDIQNYRHVTVFARAVPPDPGFARLMIVRSGKPQAEGGDVLRQEISKDWSKIDLANDQANMELMVEPSTQADVAQAAQVEVLVYLHTK